jgi:hypothetical protein
VGRWWKSENEEDVEEEASPVFKSLLSILYELFQKPRSFAFGVTALCLTCGLESPAPISSEENLVYHLGQMTVPLLHRMSAMLDLRVPETR